MRRSISPAPRNGAGTPPRRERERSPLRDDRGSERRERSPPPRRDYDDRGPPPRDYDRGR